MTLDEIEAAFRVGCCSEARLASEGCKVCGPQMAAIEAVREMARERDALRECVLRTGSALGAGASDGIGMLPKYADELRADLAAARGAISGLEVGIEYVARTVLGAAPGVALEHAARAVVADRDEARSEVRALREQRDAIREAHRVEIEALTAQRDDAKSEAAWATERAKGAEAERDALIEGLGFVEAGRDGRGSAPIYERGCRRVYAGGHDGWVCAPIYERGCRRVYAGGYDGWVCATEKDGARSTVHFDGLGQALAYSVSRDIDALTARVEAAELERDARDLSGEVLARCDTVLNGPNPETHWRSLHDIDAQVAATKARAEAAEKKLEVAQQALRNVLVIAEGIDAFATQMEKLERELKDAWGSARLWKADHDTQKARADAVAEKLQALVDAGGGAVASVGAAMIAGERLSQIGKWGPEHDKAHVRGELAIAAAQLAAFGTDASVTDPHETLAWNLVERTRGDRTRQLVVAGALIAAEIDREAALRMADALTSGGDRGTAPDTGPPPR